MAQLRNPEKRGARLGHSLPCRTYPLDDVTHFATGACAMLDSLGPTLTPLAADIDDAIAAYVASANTIASATETSGSDAPTDTSTDASTAASSGADVAATLGTALASCQLRAPRAVVGRGSTQQPTQRPTTTHTTTPTTAAHHPRCSHHR